MPVYEATREIEIGASPEQCFATLTDYAQMPRWHSRVDSVRVLETGADGLASEVEYVIDANLRKVRYRVHHTYRSPSHIGSAYAGGDFKAFEGEYSLEAGGAGTRVRFRLRIDPGLRVPGPVARMLNEAVMGQALRDLKRQVESE